MIGRWPVLVEGVVTSDGRYIEPGAIHWRDRVPVQKVIGGGPTLVGTATQVERSEDGTITAWIDADEDGWPSGDVSGVTIDATDDRFTVKDGRLAGIMLLPEDGWPWPDRPREGTP